MGMGWSEERIETVKALWTQGLSAGQIGAQIGTTRNAVIGKIFRLGLSRTERSSGISQRNDITRKQRVKNGAKGRAAMQPTRTRAQPKRPDGFKAPPADHASYANVVQRIADSGDVARVTSIVDLEAHHCRYVVGEPGDGWCGAQKLSGLSYCEDHAKRCYHTPAPRPYRTSFETHAPMKRWRYAKEHA